MDDVGWFKAGDVPTGRVKEVVQEVSSDASPFPGITNNLFRETPFIGYLAGKLCLLLRDDGLPWRKGVDR